MSTGWLDNSFLLLLGVAGFWFTARFVLGPRRGAPSFGSFFRREPTESVDGLGQKAIATLLGDWQILPNGTEGYRTAEVTLGGVDTNELSSKTMEVRKVPGLYFIGEVVDVTGWLGGYNFQWAWSSGWVAGQYC